MAKSSPTSTKSCSNKFGHAQNNASAFTPRELAYDWYRKGLIASETSDTYIPRDSRRVLSLNAIG